ncbi:sulfate transporter, putative [Pediculus humanus corporis]|uniref:Sulfate transporter, putative n=1 Tax=Pediculus humanus subsp. corporis TaxID=121224 RepID=E0VH05_PEDHC|nr:sulfate transporter, putative [Pediculus humanus corporis]EEB12661.1 sulfate transporter, putative [Pediculus humanus corporis]
MNKNNGLNTSELILTENVVAVDFSSRNGLVDDGKIKGEEEDTIIQLDGLGSNQFTLMEDDDDVIKKIVGKDQFKKLRKCFKQKIRKSLTKKMLMRRIPILTWLPKYNSKDAVGDFVAGLTVGLTVIPQALAYSSIAGLPPQYGLYSSFLGALIYIIFGSCKDVPMGPTAIISIMTYQAVQGHGVEYSTLLCFISGLIQLLMGIVGLGFMIDFVSGPVCSGFTSAVALIIVTSQIKDIFGIAETGNTFFEMWISLFKNMNDVRLWDTVLGVSSIVILLIMKCLGNFELGPKDGTKKSLSEKIITKIFWIVGSSRNAILVLLSGFLGYFFMTQNNDFGNGGDEDDDFTTYTNFTGFTNESIKSPFLLTGYLPEGMPEFKVPSFGGFDKDGRHIGFIDMMTDMGVHLIILPLIALLENIAICKAFSSGKPVDATQELIAMGLCNIGNSFVQGFPGSGSLSRSAVNNASGVRTPLGGLYTGVIVIVALLFFTPYFYFIPKASLAAVIIAAVVFMVEVKVVKPMWRTKKSDLIPGFGTFIACLVLKLEFGILLGIIIQILFLLYNAARPKIHMQKITTKSGIEYLRLTPDRCLIFPSVDYVRNIVTKHSIKQGIPVVIDCSHIYGADFTAAKVIESLSRDFVQRKQPLLFYNLKASVVSVFEGLQPEEFVTFYEHDDLDELLRRKVFEKANS